MTRNTRLVWNRSDLIDNQVLWVARLADNSTIAITRWQHSWQATWITQHVSRAWRFRVVHKDAADNITILKEDVKSFNDARAIANDFAADR